MKSKIKSGREIAGLARRLKVSRKKIVLATGCFDILHSGHIDFLRRAKNLGDVLIVGANSDASVKKIKGPPRPIVKEKLRLANLASLVYVNFACSFKETDPTKLILAIRPDVFVKGGDWKNKSLPENKAIYSVGGKVVFLPFKIKISTSDYVHSKG